MKGGFLVLAVMAVCACNLTRGLSSQTEAVPGGVTCMAIFSGWQFNIESDRCEQSGASGCSNPFPYRTEQECKDDQKDQITVRGKLIRVAGIGGESTGTAIISADQGVIEVDVTGGNFGALDELTDQSVVARGRMTKRHGVEIQERTVLIAAQLILDSSPGAYEKVVTEKIKVLGGVVHANLMPPVAPDARKNQTLELKIQAKSWGCTTDDSFAGKINQHRRSQSITITRRQADRCEAPEHAESFGLLITGYELGKPLYYNGIRVQVEELVSH